MIIDITTDSRTAVNTISDLTSEDTERQQDANTQRVAAANVITITHNVDCNTREAIQQALNELARNNPHLTPRHHPPCPTNDETPPRRGPAAGDRLHCHQAIGRKQEQQNRRALSIVEPHPGTTG